MFGLFGNSKKKEDMIREYEDADDTEYYEVKRQKTENIDWIGVDLDGTLAMVEEGKGLDFIGKPVPLMLERVQTWIAQGKKVKIMTARACRPHLIPPVQEWLKQQGLPEMEVTNEKDFNMIELWDDRAVQVLVNTGKAVFSPSYAGQPKAPMLKNEARNETFLKGDN